MAQSRTDVCNMALAHLGDAPTYLTNVDTDTSKAAQTFRSIIEATRRGLLRRFPWNFAMTPETLTLAAITAIADNGAGLIRVTKATHGFSTGNYVGISMVNGTTEANGEWTITVINVNTFDLQGSTFTNAYVDGGYVSLAPDYGYRHRHTLPSNFVRLIKMDDDSSGIAYQIAAGGIFTDEVTINFRYIADLWATSSVTDYTNMDALFYECLALQLAIKACMAINQSISLKKELEEDFRKLIAKARFVDSAENPRKQIDADEWLEARMQSVNRGFVRDPMTG